MLDLPPNPLEITRNSAYLKPVAPPKELNHYTMAFNARSQLILGSGDPREGGGFSLGVGRLDRKLRIGNVPGELIWETYFLQTSSFGFKGDPQNTSWSIGLLATARYRWVLNSKTNLFGDIGFGTQWLNETSYDVPLAFNTTPSLAIGFELKAPEGAVLVGTRLLHVSNGGRRLPNPGQNLLQFFVGFRY